jgi:hypothetical protein
MLAVSVPEVGAYVLRYSKVCVLVIELDIKGSEFRFDASARR